MKKTLALILLTCLMAVNSFADLIWKDTFSYSNGPSGTFSTNLVGGVIVTNWLIHSGSNDLIVNNRRLEVCSSSAFVVNRTGDGHRNLSITNGSIYTNAQQVLFASFIINFTSAPAANGQYFAHFQNGLSTFEGRLWALSGNPAQTTNNFTALPNTFRLGVTAANSGGPTSKIIGQDLALNTDYQVVLGWDPAGLSAATLWINPINSSDGSITSGDTFTPTAVNIASSFAFRQASGFGGFATISNLVVATTFAEAATNCLSTNAVAPKIVYQPTIGVTNFVGTTVALSAVANGQGQVGLTYQWFQSNSPSSFVPYTNPNGNSNVLTIANAQTTDSGHFRLVTTTPFGLSVTSSLSKVFISSAPVPPTFAIQPGSQTLYRGQNLTLTTTVTSPGNCTFTWISNNVAVATTGPDNTGTSSYTINNLVTNDSATYRVAVTNDVVANGIVSTNAVVTVLNPPAVTIGFLRTLVDPNNNYATTASPTQPYQVTGIITTYTNLTTGNTASYYLQDATAGINIFATFGSTFRPMMGDSVTFVGVMASFSSGLELTADTTTKTYTSYTVNSSGNTLPTPMSIPFTITNNNYAAMNTNIAGRYVQLTNVFFGTLTGTTITNGFFGVTNALGQKINLWFSAVDPDTFGRTFPAYAKTVTGVMFGSQNGGSPNFAVAPTRFVDIDTNIAPVAVADSGYSMVSNSPATTLVPSPLANDLIYPPAVPATITAATSGSGTATIINSGADVQFQPTTDFSGTATINYTITDALGGMSSSTILVSVTNVPPPPVTPLPINLSSSGGNITMTWTNATFTLQTTTNLVGPWTDVTGATSPFVTNLTARPTVFYRLFHP